MLNMDSLVSMIIYILFGGFVCIILVHFRTRFEGLSEGREVPILNAYHFLNQQKNLSLTSSYRIQNLRQIFRFQIGLVFEK